MKKLSIQLFNVGNVRLLSIALLVFVSLGACTKEGPAGPKGSANVIYSDWFTPSSYTKDTVFNTYHFYYDMVAPGITQAIIDSGLVLTFGNLKGYNQLIWPAGQVSQLPIVITYNESNIFETDTWSAYATPGKLRISFTNNTNLYNSISNAHTFRYIIIPGGISVTATKSAVILDLNGVQKAAPARLLSFTEYRAMSYDQLCETLNIPK